MQKTKAKPKKKQFGAPNRLLYTLGKAVLYPFFRFRYRLRIVREDFAPIKPPYVVLANHGSTLDFLIMGLAVKKHRVSIVTATVFFYNPFLRILLNLMGCIPKLQMVPDPTSIRQMLSAIKQGAVLGLFPHGQVCHSGKGLPLPCGTGKLLQHMKVPVISIQIHGASLTKPKWAKRRRHGRIDAHIKLLFTPEQLASHTAEQVEEAVRKAVYFNDYEYNRTARVRFRGRTLAKGLEHILYRCPRCDVLYRMQSKGNVIRCEACGNGACLDEYGQLHPLGQSDVIFEDPVQWTDYERSMEKQTLLDIGELRQPAELWVGDGTHLRFSHCGEGTVVLTGEEFRFEGTKDGSPFVVAISNTLIAGLPVSIRQAYWELPGPKQYFRFVPKCRQSLMRIVLGMEAAHEIRLEQAKPDALTNIKTGNTEPDLYI